MTTREKLIDALKKAKAEKDGTIRLSVQFRDEFIKEMKPIQTEIEGGGSTWWYVCPECHAAVDKWDHFCKHCGQALE